MYNTVLVSVCVHVVSFTLSVCLFVFAVVNILYVCAYLFAFYVVNQLS